MVYRGKVKNGVVVIEGDSKPEEGTIVLVEAVDAKKAGETLGQRLMKYAGTVEGLPSDLSRNHDHYLYGTKKK